MVHVMIIILMEADVCICHHIYQVKIAVLIQSTQFDLQEQKFFIYSNICNQIIRIIISMPVKKNIHTHRHHTFTSPW